MSAAAIPEELKPEAEGAIKEYYGQKMNTADDLKSGICTATPMKYPKFIMDAMNSVHEEVASRYFGCGPVFAPAVTGSHILDLGSGSGKDCFTLSKLVGADGFVTGLDMTDEQLDVANKYIDYHTKLFGYSTPNVKYVKGNMEQMEEAGIQDNSFDLIISNCVVNLAKDKNAVLKEANRVLKEGGELHFSDIYVDQDLPDSARNHGEMWCECISGALYWKDLHKLAAEFGFSTPRVVSANLKCVSDKSYQDMLGKAKFASVTYSLFKMPAEKSEPKTVTYNGGIEGYEDEFKFDYGISFKKGELASVGSELATILQSSRYNKYFTFADGQNGVCKCSKLDLDPFEFCANGPPTCKPTAGCC